MSTAIEMKLTDESLTELCTGGPEHGPKLARLIVEDMAEFDRYMQTLPSPVGGPLANHERALLQTYVYFKLVRAGRLDGTEPSRSAEVSLSR